MCMAFSTISMLIDKRIFQATPSPGENGKSESSLLQPGNQGTLKFKEMHPRLSFVSFPIASIFQSLFFGMTLYVTCKRTLFYTKAYCELLV